MKVIIDRRKSERRARGEEHGGEHREVRDRRRRARAGRVPAARHERVKLVVHVDGGARGNPGPAAAAAVLSTPDGEVVDEAHELLGRVTNNVAEYRGLLLGLARARELGADEVEVINDSELVAKQVNGALQGQAPRHAPAAQPGDGGAARLPALEGALGPAGPERRRRRARQSGARRGPVRRRRRQRSRPAWQPAKVGPVALADIAVKNVALPIPGVSLASPPCASHRLPGLTEPTSRGRSSRFIGDIVVDLGYATARVRRGSDRGVARQRTAHRRGARRARGPDARPALARDRRALRRRPDRPRRLHASTWRPPTCCPRARPSATARSRSRSSTTARCSSR